MKNVIHSIAAAAILALCFLASGGCEKSASSSKGIVIGMALPSLSHPFFVHLKKHVMDEAAKLGIEVVSADAEDSAARQMSIVENFIAQRVDGVLISPISAEALAPAIEALNEANIPVATVDRQISGGKVLVHVGADNVEGGRVAARYIIEKLGGRGGVIELEGVPGASPTIDRKKGFEEVLATSRVKLLADQTAQFFRAKGQSVMETLLQTIGDFQGVYAANDEMILGAIEAMDARGVDLSKVVTVGFDAIPDAQREIRNGRLTATIEQFPGEQSRRALRILVANIRTGELPPEPVIRITPVVIDRHNLDQAEWKE